MYATTTTAAATAALQMQPVTTAGLASPSSQMPVLFAVPAPRSVGKDLMCLCRKIYWTTGTLMYCAYSPVTKEEAAIFLKDPSIISILSNPVTGSNLLTVSANGAIIGVQQTVGYLANHPPPSARQLKYTETIPKKTLNVGKSGCPQEAQKAPLKSPDLPKPTTTPTEAHKPVENNSGMMPRINAVFTLADSGLNHVTLNAHATNVDTSIKMNCTTVLKDSVKECTLTTPAKDPASEAMKTEQNTLMKVPYQTLTTDPAKVSDYKINETRVLKQVAKVPVPTPQESSSKGVKHDNVVIPVVRELPNEGMVKELATQATKQLPQENIAHSNHANTTKDKGTEQLQINMPPLISTELARKAQSVGIPKLAPIHNREEPLTAIQKMSTDFDSYFANMAAKNIFANKTPTNDLANTTPKNDLAKITQKNDFANKKPKNELAEMTPKNDFANMTTRDDFANMTTRNDFANMTTRNDFANMTTRDDFANTSPKNDFANKTPKNDLTKMTPKNDLVNIPPKNGFANMTPKNDFKQSERNKVPPIVYTKNPQGPGFVGTLLESTDSMRQKEQVTSAKHADQTKDAVSQSTKNIAAPSLVNNQSNVLSDVQNKVCCNQENTDSPSRGIKRKASSVKSGETVDKKTKITKTTPSEGPPLKVKFSWTKRWTVEGGETYFRYERLPTPSQSTNVISKADNGKKVTFTDDPEIEFNFNSSEDIDGYEKINSSKGIVGFGGYEKNLLSISTKAMQTDAGRIPVHQIVYPTTVKVKLPEECIVVNNPKGYQFTYDYTKDKLISINHRIPQLKPIQKLGRDEAIRLGCSSSCPLLPAKEKPSKKQQKKHKKQKKPKFTPSYTPNLHNITKNPDFQHVPTGDKVAYLKELLRMQRAALGLSL